MLTEFNHCTVSKDVFSYEIDYFNSDYWTIGTTAQQFKNPFNNYASGKSQVTSTGKITVKRKGDEIIISGSVANVWEDLYNWNACMSAYISGHGNISVVMGFVDQLLQVMFCHFNTFIGYRFQAEICRQAMHGIEVIMVSIRSQGWWNIIEAHTHRDSRNPMGGNSAQCDQLIPVEVDHPNPEQTDQANPVQTDHPLSCI